MKETPVSDAFRYILTYILVSQGIKQPIAGEMAKDVLEKFSGKSINPDSARQLLEALEQEAGINAVIVEKRGDMEMKV